MEVQRVVQLLYQRFSLSTATVNSSARNTDMVTRCFHPASEELYGLVWCSCHILGGAACEDPSNSAHKYVAEDLSVHAEPPSVHEDLLTNCLCDGFLVGEDTKESKIK